MAPKPFESWIQDLVYNVDVGIGQRFVKLALYVLFVISIGVLYQLWHLLDGRGRLQFHFRNLALHPRMMARMLVISTGGISQFLIATSSWIIIMRIVAMYGSTAVAAYTIGLRILESVWLPSWGLGNAAATLVGQNLGAGKPDRAEKAVWITGLWNMAFMTVITVLFVLFAESIVGVFTDDPETLAVGTAALRIISYGYVFYAWGMVVLQAFNGAGDTVTPTWVNFVAFWLVQIPLAWFLAYRAGMEAEGVFVAFLAAEMARTVTGGLV